MVNDPLFHVSKSDRITRLFLMMGIVLWTSEGVRDRVCSEDTAAEKSKGPPSTVRTSAEPKLARFSFSRAPWQDVLQWLATNAGLSLHVGAVPTGSFTYSDDREYTPDEAIDRVNLFLIPQKFSLVRSHQLLSVISFDDESSVRQLDAIAELVQLEDLAGRNSRDLVKCLFPLGDVSSEQAIQELSGLLLIREPTLLRNTNQLLVTETVGKLRTVHRILESLSKDPDAGPVRVFELGELDAEQVLTQIRPHVELEPLAMTGAGIRLSLSPTGRQILVSGTKEKLRTVEGIMKLIQSSATKAAHRGRPEFQPHQLGSADLQTVLSVLQTLLADQDVRLAPDAASNQLAVMATEEIHALVDNTIRQLTNHDGVEFKAISLRSADPRSAMTMLNGMFGGSEIDKSASAASARPRIDIDPITGRLFVRAKASQIAEIERVLNELEGPAQASDSLLRLLPYRGGRARAILKSAEQFWPYSEPLLVFPASDDVRLDPALEREINPTQNRPQDIQDSHPDSIDDKSGAANPPQRNAAPSDTAIRAQLTRQGILIQSSDVDALNRFQKHLRMVAGPENPSDMRLAVFYLKHATANEADGLLKRLLAAESRSRPYPGASASNGSIVETLMHVDDPQSPGATHAWSFGTATIIADNRLNRIFAYGAARDLAEIQHHLEVIDREKSMADVRTHGSPRVISLNHAKAAEVAAVIRDAYAGRISATADERKQAAQQAQRPPQNAPNARTDGAEPQSAGAAFLENSADPPRMTLASDIQNNTLVVTAPIQLADEVERLALTIDRQAERVHRETAQVISVLPAKNPAHVYAALQEMLSESARKSRSDNTPKQEGR